MLRLAKARADPRRGDVRWVRARAEGLDLDPPIHLAVAGAAIHWMEPALLFPKLAELLAPGAPLGVVDGDAPSVAPWIDAYRGVIVGWVERLGGGWNDQAHRSRATAHEPWIDVQGRETFTHSVCQGVEDLISCEHSRATWARRRMGGLDQAFDTDLRAALAPWAQHGTVTYDVATTLTWGWPRRSPL